MLAVNYRCIIMHYRKQLWGVFHYVVLSVLREGTVGHIGCGRFHVTENIFPDAEVLLQLQTKRFDGNITYGRVCI
jgi:hypothetical protein